MSITLQAYHGSDSSWTQIGTDLVYGTNNKITLSTNGKWCNDKIKISLSGVADQDWDGSLYIPPVRVGGRIFYDAGDNGASYIFYDSSMNVLSTQTVAGLANAYYYSVSGTPTADRWYVYDNTTHSTSDGTTTYSASSGLVSSVYWGYYNITTGATTTTIGSGKTNTATVLAITDTSSYNTNTIWKYVKACNDTSLNGCSDWFIASRAEQDQLRASGLVSWYSSNVIWSAVELGANYACYWYYVSSYWDGDSKSSSCCGFAARAF